MIGQRARTYHVLDGRVNIGAEKHGGVGVKEHGDGRGALDHVDGVGAVRLLPELHDAVAFARARMSENHIWPE